MLPLQGAQVQSLITELGSCKMYSMAKKTPPMKKNCEVYQLSAVKHSHIVLQPVPRSLFVLQD